MSNRTPTRKEAQKARTRQNKIKKYVTLIEKFPNDPQVKEWQKKLAELK